MARLFTWVQIILTWHCLALYSRENKHDTNTSYKIISYLNHISIQVDHLDAIETKVKAVGLMPYHHGECALGRRFYFNLDDGLEIEVVSYH